MLETACARCGSRILSGQGYAVYSGASEGIAVDRRLFFSAPGPGGAEDDDIESKRLGVMLYCEDCADALFTEKVWEDAKALRVEMAPEDVNGPEGRQARFEVIDFCIALREKSRGIAPAQARRDASALGQLWWTDRSEAERQLLAQDRPASRTSEESLAGIGGCLRWLSIGMLISPLMMLYGAYGDFQFLRGRVVGHEIIVRIFPAMVGDIAFELISTIAMVAGLICLNVLFFGKKKIFPRCMIAFLAGCFALVLIEYLAISAGHAPATLGMGAQVQFREIQANVLHDVRAGLLRTFLVAAVWISYFLTSRRVKATFVR